MSFTLAPSLTYLRLNGKLLLAPLLLAFIYIAMALLIIAYPDLKRIGQILFGVHCILVVALYVGFRFYQSKRKELTITPAEMTYLKERFKTKNVSAEQVKKYYLGRAILLLVLSLISALPLILASINF